MADLPIEVRHLSHFGLTVSDVGRSTAFYVDVLGFRKSFASSLEGWERVGLVLDEVVIELFSAHPTEGTDAPVDMLYPASYGRPKIALTVRDIDIAYASLVEHGVPTLGPVFDTPVSRLAFVLDPDGTLIQLHQFRGGQARVKDLFDPAPDL